MPRAKVSCNSEQKKVVTYLSTKKIKNKKKTTERDKTYPQ